jgi:hypothetical protein
VAGADRPHPSGHCPHRPRPGGLSCASSGRPGPVGDQPGVPARSVRTAAKLPKRITRPPCDRAKPVRAIRLRWHYESIAPRDHRHPPASALTRLDLCGCLGGPAWSSKRADQLFSRAPRPDPGRVMMSGAATPSGDHGVVQTPRVRVARQPDASAAPATASNMGIIAHAAVPARRRGGSRSRAARDA